MSYKYLNNIREDDELIILTRQNNTFLPILNSFGKNFDLSIVDCLKQNFNNKTEIDMSSPKNDVLQNIRTYKLADLQLLAEKHNISIDMIQMVKVKKKLNNNYMMNYF